MKVAVVGGGSTYTPELADGFARLRATLHVDELTLIDPATDRLGVVGSFCARLFAQQGHPGKVTWTADLDAGLDGADVVLIQLRVGGQEARISDETFPLECGCVGQETTGAGGLAKALRTVPVVLEVAARAPAGAWIIDFTNPVGIVTRALLDAGHRAVGLCNVAIGFQRRFARLLDIPPDAVLLDHIGLNHLTWERAVRVDGVDVLPALLASHSAVLREEAGLPQRVFDALGCVPSYYLRYYYAHDEVVAREQGAPTRAQLVAAIEAELLRQYADPALVQKPALLAQRGGAFYSEAAVGLISALYAGQAGAHSANIRNSGTMSFLDDDAVIEVMCDVDESGASPRPVGHVAPAMAGLIAHVSAYEQLALEAAVHGGGERVYQALLAHPLVGQHDLAAELTDRLLASNGAHLAWAR